MKHPVANKTPEPIKIDNGALKSADDAKIGWSAPASIGMGIAVFLIPQFILGLILGFAVALFDVDIDALFDDPATTTVLAISAFTSLIGTLIVWLYTRGKGGWKALGFVKPQAKYLVHVIPVYVAYFVVLIAALTAADAFVSGFDLDQEQDLGFDEVLTPIDYIATFITLVVIAPLFEELLFRGFVFRGVAQRFGFWPSAIVVSGLFGLAHGQFNVGIDTFILGIGASWLVWRSNSLVPAILLHGLKNAVAYVTLFLIAA